MPASIEDQLRFENFVTMSFFRPHGAVAISASMNGTLFFFSRILVLLLFVESVLVVSSSQRGSFSGQRGSFSGQPGGTDDAPAFGLRSGPVHLSHEHRRSGRRLHIADMATDAVPTRSVDWGHLTNAKQVLVAPSVMDSPELLDHLERYGCRVGGYIGGGSMMIIGPGEALERALDHEHVSWVAPYEARHKVAPEWGDVLDRLREVRSSNSNLTSDGASAASGAPDASFPVDTLVSERGEQLFGVRAVFPVMHRPRPHHVTHERHFVQNERIRRHDEETRLRNSGLAAVKDWARAIERDFSVAHLEHNGRDAAKLYVRLEDIPRAIQWLADRDVVQWVEPAPRMIMTNRQASSITQSCQPVPNTNSATNTMPKYHPFWSAGITGKGIVIGIGDSGLDYKHCFFEDPDTDWDANVFVIDRVLTFTSETHRKIRLYRAFQDFEDSNGHGTHTSGTLAGMPYGNSVAEASRVNIGMAPDAKLAFIDLSSVRDGDRIITPGNLADQYFKYTTDVGATVHSDSWGSTNVFYDYESYQIDMFCWENPTFLPVFPAGNDGNLLTTGGDSGTSTVNSPATAKNCLAVGATETVGTRATYADTYVTYTGTVSINGIQSTSFPILLSTFSPPFSDLPNPEYVLLVSDPRIACSPLINSASVAGKVVLIERGTCEFVEKARYAEQAGAAAVIIYDNVSGAYFKPETSGGTVNIPVGFVPRRIGQNLVASIGTGQTISVSVGPPPSKDVGYENLASFSSQGPVNPDGRVKPDIVAPGIVSSAAAGTACSTTYFSGTSMATPVVAGNVALVQQYFMEGFYPTGMPVAENAFMPTSSLVKAVLMGGAKQITGYEADTGLPIDPAPSFRQGYGRVFLGGSLQLENNPYNPTGVQVLDSVDIVNGQKHTYCVTSTGGPLSVTVAWTDYPANPNQRKSLVNDIDLVVRAEGFNGIPFLGNGGGLEDSSLGDAVNNVEQARWEFLPAGRVAIEIYGANIYSNQIGPQPYSLVVNGDFAGTLVAPGPGQNQEDCPVVSAVITSGPPEVTNSEVISFEFGVGASGSSAGFSFECMLAAVRDGQVIDGQWTACSSPAEYRDVPDGEYIFSVKPSQESSVAKQTFVVDRSPPILQVVSLEAPVGLARYGITATDSLSQAQPECMIEGEGVQPTLFAGGIVASQVKAGEWFPCGPEVTFGWLLAGQTMMYTRAVDEVGNVSPTDTKAVIVPNDGRTYITSGPFATIPAGEVTFSMVSPAAQTFECALLPWPTYTEGPGLPQQWRPCDGQTSLDVVTDGKYSFFAKAAGAPIDLAASSTFVVDEIAPTVSFVDAKPVSTQQQLEIQFEASENSTAECRLVTTGEDWAPCESPVVYTNLDDGIYVLEVRATDFVGNRGDPQQHEFTVDTTPPTVTVDYQEGTREPSMTVTFTAEDGNGSGVANVTCRLVPVKLVGQQVNVESASYDPQPCTSPWTFQLEEGEWEISIVATDNAGISSTGQAITIWMDTVPPVPMITSGPPNDTVVAGGSVEFNITDGMQGNGGSPVVWQGYLSLDSTSIDDQPAETSSSAGPGAAIKSVDAKPLGPDNVDQWANCTTTRCVYEGIGVGTYTFVARGVDAAGNEGPESEPWTFRLAGASNSLPTWALIVIIVASCVGALLIAGVLWCCLRKPSASRQNKDRPGPQTYDVNSYATNVAAFQNVYQENGYQQQNGYQSGTIAGARPFAGAVNDPIEAQRQALAQYQGGGGSSRQSGAAMVEDEDERRLRLAMAMSLAER